jgi:3-hydroxybutyrate dehydrogenase
LKTEIAGTLEDETRLVTGGASGMGLEIAKTFAAAVGRVTIADIDAAEKTAPALGAAHLGVPMDVTDGDAIQRGVDKVIKAPAPSVIEDFGEEILGALA